MIDCMKKNHIPGDIRCLRCSGPTRNATPFLCLPCLIELNGQKVVGFALDARFHKNSRFSGPRLLAFAEKYPGIFGGSNKSILNLKSIIKGAEQARQDVKTIVESRDCFSVSPIIRLPVTSAKSRQPRLHARLDKLLMQLITEQEGLCPYCASSLTPQTTHLDTVLPTGFDHSQICLTTRIKYYEANVQAGNLKAVCGACNFHKGVAEYRGLDVLRKIASRKYPAQPVKDTSQYSNRKPRINFTHQDLPGKKRSAYALAEWETIKQAIECFALRVTYPCTDVTDWLFAGYDEESRTLIFGCEDCVPPDGAILAVDVRKKNWFRTDRHHFSPLLPELKQIQAAVEILPPCRRSEFVFERLENKLRQRMGKLKKIGIPIRRLQTQAQKRLVIEKELEMKKWLHKKFNFPPPPPLDVLEAFYKARAAEADAHFFVWFRE
jgi:hypothetical protein